MTNGTVLVASPSAIGRQPEASGSSVPAWPARLHWNSRLIAPTAWVEVMPTGLSSTIQPCTSRLMRRNCCCLNFCSGGRRVSSLPPCGGGLGRRVCRGFGVELDSPASPSGGEAREFAPRDSLFIVVLALEVALDCRRSQKLL